MDPTAILSKVFGDRQEPFHKKVLDRGLGQSPKRKETITMNKPTVFTGAATVTITEEALTTSNLELAARIEPLEQVIDDLRDDIKIHHIQRLKKSECTVEHGFVLSDILTNLERVSDHCSNIGGCLIEMAKNDTLDLHDYLHRVHVGGMEYKELFGEYKAKYALPESSEQ